MSLQENKTTSAPASFVQQDRTKTMTDAGLQCMLGVEHKSIVQTPNYTAHRTIEFRSNTVVS